MGKTPIVRYSYRHDRISALAALTISAQRKNMGLYTRFQRENFKAEHVAEFLRAMLSHIRGPIVLLWDGGKIHKGPRISKVLVKNPRLHIEWFPAYAPELDPVEQVWNDFKRHTANSLPLTRQNIRASLHANSRRAQNSQARLRSYILSSKLPSSPW